MQYLLKMIILLGVSVIIAYLTKTTAWQKQEIKKQKMLLERKIIENKQKDIRIDKISEVATAIATVYPEVGESIHGILVDLKNDLTIGIDQKLSELPDDMQSLVISRNIATHGLKNYRIVDRGYIFPVDDETSYISSKWGEFGWRPQIYTDDTLEYVYNPKVQVTKWKLHPACDFVNHRKPEVIAANSGLIIHTGVDKRGGNYIIIEHRFPNYPLRKTSYFHLSEIYVKEGQYVAKGQLIGVIGQSGKTVTTDLLHFEYKEYMQTPYGPRWVNKNYVLDTTHNNNRIAGYYWVKIDSKWVVKIL
jgi:hypothetical protein